MAQIQKCIYNFKNWIKTAELSEKKHQTDGIAWCLKREIEKLNGVRGGLVADEMGLGKTIIMLGIIVANYKSAGTVILVPPALLDQWVVEIERLFGHDPVIYHGRELKNTKKLLESKASIPILISTYGIVMTRKKGDPLFERTWGRMICDEAHHMRNEKKLFEKMKLIKSNIKWMVTGTPIQNKAKDLLALCNVIGLQSAMEKSPADTKKIIMEHSLRRTKKQIGIKLPPVNYHVINVPWLSEEEREFAADIHAQLAFPNVTKRNVNSVMSFLGGRGPLPWLTRSRQACIFPHLLQRNIQTLIDEGVVSEDADVKHIKTTSKITAVVKKLIERKQNNRRKLVFSHYHGEIDILSSLLKKFGITCSIIDGRQSTKQKSIPLKKFCRRTTLDPCVKNGVKNHGSYITWFQNSWRQMYVYVKYRPPRRDLICSTFKKFTSPVLGGIQLSKTKPSPERTESDKTKRLTCSGSLPKILVANPRPSTSIVWRSSQLKEPSLGILASNLKI